MLRRLVFSCSLLYTSAVFSASTLEEATLITRLGYGHDLHGSSRNATTLELSPDFRFKHSESVRSRLSLRLVGDERDSLVPGKPRLKNYDPLSKPLAIGDSWLLELRDAYVELEPGGGLVRLGKQQLVWGSLDGIKVLDVLNPQSFEHFILAAFDESRIGLWSAYSDFTRHGWRFEGALIPDATTHYIPESNSFFEFKAPRFRFGQMNLNTSLPIRDAGPDDDRGTAAIRLSRYARGVDFQLVATSGLDFEPLGRTINSNNQQILETYHERRSLFGIGMETSFSSFALRGELSYSPNRVFNLRGPQGLTADRLANWRGGVGIDWSAPLGLFVNLQYLHEKIVSASRELVKPVNEQLVTLFARKRLLHDTLNVEFRWYEGLKDHDRLLRLLMSYQTSDRSTLKLALDNFRGTSRGVFGQFDPRDQLSLRFEHSF